MSRLNYTRCCALATLRANNADTEASLKKSLGTALRNHKNGGITTVQCIVTPNEKILTKNLKNLGFKNKCSFKRRDVYGKAPLKIMMLDLSTYTE